jgi:hypothetical protein
LSLQIRAANRWKFHSASWHLAKQNNSIPIIYLNDTLKARIICHYNQHC